jgi:hypothetical protein
MKGKIRVLLDEKTDYMAVVETLGSKINQLNREILSDEERIKSTQTTLKEMFGTLSYHLKGRSQMLETLKRMKLVKKQKDIDCVVTNPSEKITLDNPEIDLCVSEEEWNRKAESDRLRREEEKRNANNTN